MLIASRVPVRAWKAIGWVALVAALLAQALVFSPLGVSVNGNRNWIGVGGMRLQPSEAMKLALVLWGAAVLARKRLLLDRWVHVAVPVMFPVGFIAIGLVLAGHDLGTALVLLMILAALLFAAGRAGPRVPHRRRRHGRPRRHHGHHQREPHAAHRELARRRLRRPPRHLLPVDPRQVRPR